MTQHNCRLPSPPVQTVELNPLAVGAAVGHEYEDLEKYTATIPLAASGDEYEVVKCHDYDAVQHSAAAGQVGGGGGYDDIKHTEAIGGPAQGTTANDAVEYSEVTGPVGGTTASGDDFDITKCPAYVPVQSQDPK